VKDILSEFQVPVIFITAFPSVLLTGERPEPTFLITKPFQRSTVKARSPRPCSSTRRRAGLRQEPAVLQRALLGKFRIEKDERRMDGHEPYRKDRRSAPAHAAHDALHPPISLAVVVDHFRHLLLVWR
jgi:hypothetical protein